MPGQSGILLGILNQRWMHAEQIEAAITYTGNACDPYGLSRVAQEGEQESFDHSRPSCKTGI